MSANFKRAMMTSMSNSTAGRPRPRIFPADHDGVNKEWMRWVEPRESAAEHDDWALAADYWDRVEIDGVGFPIWVRFGQTELGDFVVTGMLMGDPDGGSAIGTGALNKIAVNDILASASDLSETDSRIIDHARDFIGRVPTPGGQPSDERVYAQAAFAWALLKVLGRTATVSAVAAMLNTSRPTASRRIQRARDEGLLQTELDRLKRLDRDEIVAEAEISDLNTGPLNLPPF